MNPGISEEVGLTTRSIIGVMKESPLSLALVCMNILLVAYLFYSGSSVLEQRTAMSKLIIEWQQQLQPLLASCVSQETVKVIVDNVQRTTETLLAAEQREINRMQKVINEEREFNRSLLPNFPRPQGSPPTAPDPAVSGPR